jgi:hypothetical protein
MKFAVSSFVAACIAIQTCSGQQPSFSTKSQELVVFEGETIEISCELQNASNYLPVFWLNGSSILSTVRRVFGDDRRISIEGTGNTYNLRVRNIRDSDDGVYSCQVPGQPTVTQNNRIIVSKPPSITVHPGQNVQIDTNGFLELECLANGRPKPTVIWSRKDKRLLPSGRQSDEGEQLVIRSVQRSAGGQYICTADNGIGSPVNKTITVTVLYAPIINMTSEVVHTGPGHSLTIECIVQSDPEADIIWFHNSSNTPIDLNRRKNIKKTKEKLGNSTIRWTLEFNSVQARDLGMYKCEGRNDIGPAYGIITLSPYPYRLEITSSPVGWYRNQYTLQWTVTSHSPLIDFTLFLKQLNDTYDTQWVQYNIPASSSGNSPTHSQEYILRDLVSGSKYLATMRARNTYGDSRISEEFRFSTALGLLKAVPQPVTIIVAFLLVTIVKQLQL